MPLCCKIIPMKLGVTNVYGLIISGEDPISAHNRYPELWAQINREFVEEWKSGRVGKQNEDPEEALVFFMRAGFRDSPKWGMLFWEGDQMVSWQTNDGIKSAVVGLLSSGLSGYAFNHSDIGGYCAVNFPFIKYHRSEELLLRWMELNAFTTVFRTHEVSYNTTLNTFTFNSKRLQVERLVKKKKKNTKECFSASRETNHHPTANSIRIIALCHILHASQMSTKPGSSTDSNS